MVNSGVPSNSGLGNFIFGGAGISPINFDLGFESSGGVNLSGSAIAGTKDLHYSSDLVIEITGPNHWYSFGTITVGGNASASNRYNGQGTFTESGEGNLRVHYKYTSTNDFPITTQFYYATGGATLGSSATYYIGQYVVISTLPLNLGGRGRNSASNKKFIEGVGGFVLQGQAKRRRTFKYRPTGTIAVGGKALTQSDSVVLAGGTVSLGATAGFKLGFKYISSGELTLNNSATCFIKTLKFKYVPSIFPIRLKGFAFLKVVDGLGTRRFYALESNGDQVLSGIAKTKLGIKYRSLTVPLSLSGTTLYKPTSDYVSTYDPGNLPSILPTSIFASGEAHAFLKEIQFYTGSGVINFSGDSLTVSSNYHYTSSGSVLLGGIADIGGLRLYRARFGNGTISINSSAVYKKSEAFYYTGTYDSIIEKSLEISVSHEVVFFGRFGSFRSSGDSTLELNLKYQPIGSLLELAGNVAINYHYIGSGELTLDGTFARGFHYEPKVIMEYCAGGPLFPVIIDGSALIGFSYTTSGSIFIYNLPKLIVTKKLFFGGEALVGVNNRLFHSSGSLLSVEGSFTGKFRVHYVAQNNLILNMISTVLSSHYTFLGDSNSLHLSGGAITKGSSRKFTGSGIINVAGRARLRKPKFFDFVIAKGGANLSGNGIYSQGPPPSPNKFYTTQFDFNAPKLLGNAFYAWKHNSLLELQFGVESSYSSSYYPYFASGNIIDFIVVSSLSDLRYNYISNLDSPPELGNYALTSSTTYNWTGNGEILVGGDAIEVYKLSYLASLDLELDVIPNINFKVKYVSQVNLEIDIDADYISSDYNFTGSGTVEVDVSSTVKPMVVGDGVVELGGAAGIKACYYREKRSLRFGNSECDDECYQVRTGIRFTYDYSYVPSRVYTFQSIFNGNNLIPASGSNKTGTGFLSVNTDDNSIFFRIDHNLTSTVTGFTIKSPSTPDTNEPGILNGGISLDLIALGIPLTIGSNFIQGNFSNVNLTPGQQALFNIIIGSFLNGTAHIIISTSGFPGGEIRGQVYGQTGAIFLEQLTSNAIEKFKLYTTSTNEMSLGGSADYKFKYIGTGSTSLDFNTKVKTRWRYRALGTLKLGKYADIKRPKGFYGRDVFGTVSLAGNALVNFKISRTSLLNLILNFNSSYVSSHYSYTGNGNLLLGGRPNFEGPINGGPNCAFINELAWGSFDINFIAIAKLGYNYVSDGVIEFIPNATYISSAYTYTGSGPIEVSGPHHWYSFGTITVGGSANVKLNVDYISTGEIDIDISHKIRNKYTGSGTIFVDVSHKIRNKYTGSGTIFINSSGLYAIKSYKYGATGKLITLGGSAPVAVVKHFIYTPSGSLITLSSNTKLRRRFNLTGSGTITIGGDALELPTFRHRADTVPPFTLSGIAALYVVFRQNTDDGFLLGGFGIISKNFYAYITQLSTSLRLSGRCLTDVIENPPTSCPADTYFCAVNKKRVRCSEMVFAYPKFSRTSPNANQNTGAVVAAITTCQGGIDIFTRKRPGPQLIPPRTEIIPGKRPMYVINGGGTQRSQVKVPPKQPKYKVIP